jgi:hypothetical protein
MPRSTDDVNGPLPRVGRPRVTTRASSATTDMGTRVVIALGLGALLLLSAVVTPNTSVAAALPSAASRPGSAVVAESLPQGWTWSRGHTRLTWRAPRPLPLTAASIEIRVDGRSLPGARVGRDRRSVSVDDLEGAAVKNFSSLQVVAGRRRLDTAAASVPSRPTKSSTRQPKRTPGATPPALAAKDDPGRPGPYRTERGEYELPDLTVKGLPLPVEMRAVVVRPADASGPRPVAVFLHGAHRTCYRTDANAAAGDTGDWPCPSGYDPVPSYRGYLQSQELLATQGWITFSISANSINAHEDKPDYSGADARSALIRAHLARWAAWSASDTAWATAPAVVRAGPRPDLQKVLLIGHSRGGDGVNRASLDSTTGSPVPWQIGGQVLIAPTSYALPPATGVPTVVLLAACDGDVPDWQGGQRFVDEARDVTIDPALRSSVFIKGANHNYFNAQWTPGSAQAPADDDWGDRRDADCDAQSPTRLDAAQQRQVGAVYTAAAAQVLVLHREAVSPLLDGSAVRAASAGQAQILAAALGGRRRPLLVPTSDTAATGTAATISPCYTHGRQTPRCDIEEMGEASPHFPPAVDPGRVALAVDWTAPEGAVSAGLSDPAVEASATALTMRIIVPPAARDTSFDVRLIDRSGHQAKVASVSMNGLLNDVNAGSGHYWAQEVRVPLQRAQLSKAGLDLSHLSRLQFAPRCATGKLWLLDAWSYRPGLADSAPVRLPRVDLDLPLQKVVEGDADHTVEVSATVTGTINKPATVWFGVGDVDLPLLTLAPGTKHFSVRIPIHGNKIDNADDHVTMYVAGVRNILAGIPDAMLSIEDDDPTPAVTVTPHAAATEGSSLVWAFTVAGETGQELFPTATFIAPADGSVELTAGDLDADWLKKHRYLGSPDVPLSETGLTFNVFIEPGSLTGTLELPVAADSIIEGAETVRLAFTDASVPGLPDNTIVTGTVTDPG